MAMVCSRCSALHGSSHSCPRCGAPAPANGSTVEGPVRWQHTPWGRLALGLALSQGLFYGLRQLLTGVFLAIGTKGAADVWHGSHGTILLQSAQLLSLFLGGTVAAGGQRHGTFLGAMVGLWNGLLTVFVLPGSTAGAAAASLYSVPLIHAAVGTVGGMIGCLIWRPIPDATPPGLVSGARKPAPRRAPSPFAGPIAWVRVCLGSALAVTGTLSASFLFRKLLDLGGDKLGTSSLLQDQIITWEIRALALLAGGTLAGATTPNGLKQGLVVGVFTSLALIVLEGHGTKQWLWLVSLTLVACFSLTLVGGWFGGALFPPVVKINRRDNLRAAPTY